MIGGPRFYTPFDVALSSEPLVMLVLTFVFGLGFTILNTLTKGVVGIILTPNYPLYIPPLKDLLLHTDRLCLSFFSASLIAVAAWSFDDNLWIDFGRRAGIMRTWNTLIKKGSLKRGLLIPLVLLFFVIFSLVVGANISIKLNPPNTLSESLRYIIPLLTILSLPEVTYMTVRQLKVDSITHLKVATLTLLPLLLLISLNINENLAVLVIPPILGSLGKSLYSRKEVDLWGESLTEVPSEGEDIWKEWEA
ncbi:MAG: hypothetical protein QXR62_05060 [Candidatus Bathyarchaeia archaeon]